jgi:hypothetical protein
VKFAFVAKYRGIWPAGWMCGALGVSRGGFYAFLARPRSRRARRTATTTGPRLETGAVQHIITTGGVCLNAKNNDPNQSPRRVWDWLAR